jgi:hypothetical protein
VLSGLGKMKRLDVKLSSGNTSASALQRSSRSTSARRSSTEESLAAFAQMAFEELCKTPV